MIEQLNSMITLYFIAIEEEFIMARNDSLDVVIKEALNLLSKDDCRCLAEAIGEIDLFDELFDNNKHDLAKIFNREIRTNYGHTVANLYKELFTDKDNAYDIDYIRILAATADKLDVKCKVHGKYYDSWEEAVDKSAIIDTGSIDKNGDIEHLEFQIINQVIKKIKEYILEHKGKKAWEEIDAKLKEEAYAMFLAGEITEEAFKSINIYLASGLCITAFIALAKQFGFEFYKFSMVIIFDISKILGLGWSVAGAGCTASHILHEILNNKLVFILGIVLTIYGLGDTNWSKTISAIIVIAGLRQILKNSNNSIIYLPSGKVA